MPRPPKPTMGTDPASNLRALREWKGITLRELEEAISTTFKTGISNANLSRMERGKQGIGRRSAQKLAKYFGVRISDLCTDPS